MGESPCRMSNLENSKIIFFPLKIVPGDFQMGAKCNATIVVKLKWINILKFLQGHTW